jgi:hypothetical protein
MSIATFIENYHYRYTNRESHIVRVFDINLPDELGDELSVPSDEPLLWFKIALIRYHVREVETG